MPPYALRNRLSGWDLASAGGWFVRRSPLPYSQAMGRSPAGSSAATVEGGLDELLRVERELAAALDGARTRAEAIVSEARAEVERLRGVRRAEVEEELATIERIARRELAEELAGLEREHVTLVRRYRAIEGVRLEELAEGVARDLLEELQGDR